MQSSHKNVNDTLGYGIFPLNVKKNHGCGSNPRAADLNNLSAYSALILRLLMSP